MKISANDTKGQVIKQLERQSMANGIVGSEIRIAGKPNPLFQFFINGTHALDPPEKLEPARDLPDSAPDASRRPT